MTVLIVVDRVEDWPHTMDGVSIITSWDYLTDPAWHERRRVRVFNLCRSYRYQTAGYYVSLLALARGHKPLPDITAIQDFRLAFLPRWLNDELEQELNRSLKSIESSRFVLSVYFGRNMAARHERLARRLFNLIPAPLVRAEFEKRSNGWIVKTVRPIALGDVPGNHREFVTQAAAMHFASRTRSARSKPARFSMAILSNPEEADAPSDPKALKLFEKAFIGAGFEVDFLRKDDLPHVGEYDALFIRETTAVNHHTYRFARAAERDDIVCIDDAQSILRCTNKVFLAELLQRHGIAAPRTIITHRQNVDDVGKQLGFPLVLKLPDSAFSVGVIKVESEADLAAARDRFFKRSELIVAQAYTPTEFDWRIGVLDGQPLYACRYFMARKHWQIIDRDGKGKAIAGRSDCPPIDEVPKAVLQAAVKASNAIGRGLYGVDLKQTSKGVLVIEVNDNPNLDAGVEDEVLGTALYDRIASVFMHRVEARTRGQR